MSDTQKTQSQTAGVDNPVFVRLLFMILFGFIGYFVFWASIVVAAVQFVVRLVTGSVNDELVGISAKLSDYMNDVLRFVSFQTEDKPFPFNDTDSTDVTVTDA